VGGACPIRPPVQSVTWLWCSAGSRLVLPGSRSWCGPAGHSGRSSVDGLGVTRNPKINLLGGIFRAGRAVAKWPSPRSVFGRTRLSWSYGEPGSAGLTWRSEEVLGRHFATARMTRMNHLNNEVISVGTCTKIVSGLRGIRRPIDTPTSPQEHSARQETLRVCTPRLSDGGALVEKLGGLPPCWCQTSHRAYSGTCAFLPQRSPH
jgi:hypothetical protein